MSDKPPPRWNSFQMAANARKNKGKSPWRTKPHVNTPENHKRHKEWQPEC